MQRPREKKSLRRSAWMVRAAMAVVVVATAAPTVHGCEPIVTQDNTWCMNCGTACFPLVDNMLLHINGQEPHANPRAKVGRTEIATNISTTGALSDGPSAAPKILMISASANNDFTFAFDTLKNLKQLHTIALDNVTVYGSRAHDFVPTSKLSHILLANCKTPNAIMLDFTELPELAHVEIQNCNLTGVPLWSAQSSLQTIKLVNVGLTAFPTIGDAVAPSVVINLTQNAFTSLTPTQCAAIRTRNISVDDAVAAQCGATPRVNPSDSLSLFPSTAPPPLPASNPWSSVFTIIVVIVMGALIGVFVMHRKRLLSPLMRTPGADEYLTGSTPIMEGHQTDAILSKAKDEMTLSEPILTPFPPRFGRTYSLLPPKDVKLGRVPKAPSGLLSAQYRKESVTLHRLDYRDQEQGRIDAFLQKLELLATLVHPNVTKLVGATKLSGVSICAVFDHGPSDQGLPSFLFQAAGTVAAADALDARMRTLAVGVASAVSYLHATTDRSLARLLTSSNVSVRSSDGSVRLSTMPWMDATTAHDDDDDRIVSYGSYGLASVAPEVLTAASPASSRPTDVFALGIILGEIASCGRPYAAHFDDVGAVAGDVRIHAIYTSPTAAIAPFPTLPPGPVASVIASCLHRDPADRPTAEAIVAALHACLGDVE